MAAAGTRSGGRKASSSSSSPPPRPSATSKMAVAAMAAVVLLLWRDNAAPVAEAGWIDPDTPEDAYTTWSLPAHPPRPPPPPKAASEKTATTTTTTTTTTMASEESADNVDCASAVGANGTLDETACGNATTSPAPTTTSPTEAPTTLSPTAAPTTMSPTTSPTEPFVPREYKLVMSDEFNVPGRTFADGSDPMWTALHKNDYTNDAQHFYSNRNAYTDDDGHLVIETEARDTEFIGYDDVHHRKAHATKHFRSAMMQSWNKFCFTGGIIETEVIMPGKSDVGGLWPAFWLLGNLARHTYVASSEHVWPWSVTKCNQKSRDSQLISGCSKALHWGMDPQVGRGSPEIDIFEVQAGNIKANTGKFINTYVGQPFMSASFQIAPGIPDNRPGPGYWPGPGQWYDGLVGGNQSALNILFYGAYNHFMSDTDAVRQDYWSDALSYNRQLTKEHFEKKHRYRLEWELPDKDTNNDGYLHWFLNDQLVLKINGTTLAKRGLGTEISSEPSYIIMNTAISSQWGFPNTCPDGCPCKEYDCNTNNWLKTCGFSWGFCDMLKQSPAKYKINYVRVYQDPNDPKQKVGCSTPERPTRRWIEAHQEQYMLETDSAPLKPIQRGGGSCSTDEECGGSKRGWCVGGGGGGGDASGSGSGSCSCEDSYTGPNCLAHDGYDDVLWDEPDTLADVGFHPPAFFPAALVVGFVACIVVLFVGLVLKRKRDSSGYAPLLNNRNVGGQFS